MDRSSPGLLKGYCFRGLRIGPREKHEAQRFSGPRAGTLFVVWESPGLRILLRSPMGMGSDKGYVGGEHFCGISQADPPRSNSEG